MKFLVSSHFGLNDWSSAVIMCFFNWWWISMPRALCLKGLYSCDSRYSARVESNYDNRIAPVTVRPATIHSSFSFLAARRSAFAYALLVMEEVRLAMVMVGGAAATTMPFVASK